MKGRQEIIVLCLTLLMCAFIDTVYSDSKHRGSFKPRLIDCCNTHMNNCLLVSAYTGREECLRLLLNMGVNVNYQSPDDGSPALLMA